MYEEFSTRKVELRTPEICLVKIGMSFQGFFVAPAIEIGNHVAVALCPLMSLETGSLHISSTVQRLT